jgi:hypothetical protein
MTDTVRQTAYGIPVLKVRGGLSFTFFTFDYLVKQAIARLQMVDTRVLFFSTFVLAVTSNSLPAS